MATRIKKTRIKEADQFVDQNVATQPAQPADAPAPVATDPQGSMGPTAVPSQDVAEPITEPEPVFDEPMEDTEDSGIDVNPETVGVQVQIPTDQLAAAIAQATGDTVAAEASPELEQQRAEEEGDMDDMDYQDDFGGEEPMVAEEETPMGSEPALDQQPQQPQPQMESKKRARKSLKEAEEIADEIADEVEEIPEDDDVPEEDIDEEEEVDEDDDDLGELPDAFAPSDSLDDIDDLFGGSPDSADLLNKIEDFVKSDDKDISDVSDALKTAATFLDQIADDKKFNFSDVIDTDDVDYPAGDEELTDAYDDFVDKANKKGVDYSISFSSDDDEDDEEEEEDIDPEDIDDFDDEDSDDLWDDEDDEEEDFDPEEEEELRKPRKPSIYDDIDEVEESRVRRVPCKTPSRVTKKPVITKRHSLHESTIIYPAGSYPITKDNDYDADYDYVGEQEAIHESRRKAIKSYRENLLRQREDRRQAQKPINRSRFNEALRSSVRSVKESEEYSPNSWAGNNFMVKYEESSKLNYKDLLNNGFLG